MLGDTITTDHISPAGEIPKDYPAGRYLLKNNIQPVDFNTYGSRRGNHQIMMRGTFGNIRIENLLASKIAIERCPTGAIVWLQDGVVKGREAVKIIRKEALPLE